MKSGAWRGWMVPVFATVGLVVFATFGCGSDSLVGGGCREGLDECSLKCVDLRQDPKNCGACGRACPAGVACSAGVCGGAGEGGIADGGGDDGSLGDGTRGDGSTGDGTSGDGASGDGGGGGCSPPFDTPERCGDCHTKCVDPTPVFRL